MDPADGTTVLDEVAAALARPGGLRNANAFFMVRHATRVCVCVTSYTERMHVC